MKFTLNGLGVFLTILLIGCEHESFIDTPWYEPNKHTTEYFIYTESPLEYFTTTGVARGYYWRSGESSKKIWISEVKDEVQLFIKNELEKSKVDINNYSEAQNNSYTEACIISINPIIVIIESSILNTYWFHKGKSDNPQNTEYYFRYNYHLAYGTRIVGGGPNFLWFSPDLEIGFTEIDFIDNKGTINFNNEKIVIHKTSIERTGPYYPGERDKPRQPYVYYDTVREKN